MDGAGIMGVENGFGAVVGAVTGVVAGGGCCPQASAAPSKSAKGATRAPESTEPFAAHSVLRELLKGKENLILLE